MKPILPLITVLLLLQGCSMFFSSEDRGERTLGTMLDDQRTEAIATKNIRSAHPDLEDAHFTVTSFNGIVLLTGQVPSEELRELAADTVDEIRHVKRVHNELQVAGPISMLARTNDNLLATKAKSRLYLSDQAEGGRIKVVAEDGVIYLMGLLTRGEADAAVEVVKKVAGVQKIVKVFEYIN